MLTIKSGSLTDRYVTAFGRHQDQYPKTLCGVFSAAFVGFAVSACIAVLVACTLVALAVIVSTTVSLGIDFSKPAEASLLFFGFVSETGVSTAVMVFWWLTFFAALAVWVMIISVAGVAVFMFGVFAAAYVIKGWVKLRNYLGTADLSFLNGIRNTFCVPVQRQ